MKKYLTFENLEVYQKLCKLHLEVSEITFIFPTFELHEIGSELRRTSNSAPASIAEGCNNKHIKFYIDRVNQALGDVRQTKHYLNIAFKKSYIDQEQYIKLIHSYDECTRLLKSLEKSITSYKTKHNTFTKDQYPNNYHY